MWTWRARIHYIPRMNLVTRSGAALVALAALAFPWTADVVVVAHLASEEHHHAKPVVNHTAGVTQIVHEHHHEVGTPVHQHTLVLAEPATLTTRLSLVVASVAFLSPASAATSPATGSLVAPADLAHSPPQIPKSSLILRI